MAFSLIASTGKSLGVSGGTSDAIDTTGTNLIIVSAGWYALGSGESLTDSKSNTWTALTSQISGETKVRIYYCLNPSVGSGHTFTFSGSNLYTAIEVTAWSGAHSSSSFDQQNGAANSGTSISTGSITPSEDNELVIAALCTNSATLPTIDGGFTISHRFAYTEAVREGSGQAYLIQTTATAANPSWNVTDSRSNSAAIASFKAAAGATTHGRLIGGQLTHSILAGGRLVA